MLVYLALHTLNPEDYCTIGIFSTEEKGIEALKAHKEHCQEETIRKYTTLSLEAFRLDNIIINNDTEGVRFYEL